MAQWPAETWLPCAASSAPDSSSPAQSLEAAFSSCLRQPTCGSTELWCVGKWHSHSIVPAIFCILFILRTYKYLILFKFYIWYSDCLLEGITWIHYLGITSKNGKIPCCSGKKPNFYPLTGGCTKNGAPKMKFLRNYSLSISLLALGLAATLTFGNSSTYAYADGLSNVGGITTPGIDLSQGWNEAGVGNFDSIYLFIETPGISFSDVGGLSDGGWSGSLVNPTFDLLTGEAISSLTFYTDLMPDPVANVTMDFYSLLGGIVVDSATVTYPDAAGNFAPWNVGSLDPSSLSQENTSATPEPSSLILLGTGLVGLAGVARRKFFTV